MHSRLIPHRTCDALIRVRFTRASCSVLIILSTLIPGALNAQTSYCRTNADTAGMFLAGLQGAYEEMDTTVLKAQGKPYAAPADISLVTSSNTCKSGVNAYNKARGSGQAALSSAYVVALGRNGYVVINPQETMGEFTAMWIFDRRWTYKVRLAG